MFCYIELSIRIITQELPHKEVSEMCVQVVPGVPALQPYQVHGAHRNSVFKTDTEFLPITVVQMEILWKLCESKCRNHYYVLLHKQWGLNLEWKVVMKGTQKYRDTNFAYTPIPSSPLPSEIPGASSSCVSSGT